MRRASTALDHLMVLDLTRARAGPTCARQLADWGADVIKIEMREADPANSGQSDFAARNDPDFQNLHRNKRGLTLDLKHPEGLAVLKRLATRADVLVENYRPDVKRRLGIDYESLKPLNRRLIYASISGFGQSGPYRDRPGVDQIAQGMSGLMSITGEPGRGPMRVGIAIADLTAGMFTALGILVALAEREKSGEGQFVESSLLAANLFMLDFQGARYTMSGEVPDQAGNDHPTGVPTGTYPTKDGHINIAPTPPMWRRLCTAIGREELIGDPDFATPKARRVNRAKVRAALEPTIKSQTSAFWIERLNQAGVPCGPINRIDQAFADPQVRHLGIVQQARSRALGEIALLGQPVTLSRTPSRIAEAAPDYGEHSDEILASCGYSPAEIARLKETGAV